ncbi:MAG: 16S rRNA (guanine(527)-N(7))-methyltransferase RsmG [Clostridia bacterium]
MENNDFKFKLKNESEKYNFNLTCDMLNKFEIYKDLLLEWNNKFNLTAITDEDEIIVKHFIDCMFCIKYIKNGDRVIDIGSGAGFPGIVIAIMLNNTIDITLADSLNKRITFLNEVINKLNLDKTNAIHKRIEDIKSDDVEMYDIVVCRAVAKTNVLTEFSAKYLKIGGKCVFMKSSNINDEINLSLNAFKILKCKFERQENYKIVVNDETFLRSILTIKKIDKTPNIYPRSMAKIKVNPL